MLHPVNRPDCIDALWLAVYIQEELLEPGFHVAKSVKLENLDKTPTLGEITGVLNQYYMNLQPK